MFLPCYLLENIDNVQSKLRVKKGSCPNSTALFFFFPFSSSSTSIAFRAVFLSRLLHSSSFSLPYTNKSTAKEAKRPQVKFGDMTGSFQFTAFCPASCYLEILRLKYKQIQFYLFYGCETWSLLLGEDGFSRTRY